MRESTSSSKSSTWRSNGSVGNPKFLQANVSKYLTSGQKGPTMTLLPQEAETDPAPTEICFQFLQGHNEEHPDYLCTMQHASE